MGTRRGRFGGVGTGQLVRGRAVCGTMATQRRVRKWLAGMALAYLARGVEELEAASRFLMIGIEGMRGGRGSVLDRIAHPEPVGWRTE